MSEGFDVYGVFEGLEEDYGFDNSVLPGGTYPVEITQAKGDVTREKHTPRVRMGVKVLDGPFEGKHAFFDVYLVDFFDPEVMAEKKKFAAMTKGLLKAIGAGLAAGVDPANFPTTGEAAVAAYAPEEWVGKKFIAGVSVESVEKQLKSMEKSGYDADPAELSPRNRLSSWHAWDGEKGYAWWKEEVLPKQLARERKTATKSAPQVL